MGRLTTSTLVIAGLTVLGACAPKEEAPAPEPVPEPEPVVEEVAAEPVVAVAVLQPKAGSTVSGRVTFTEIEGGVSIVAEVSGAAAGLHGIHLHELGDCSAEDFTSAGGHFNPTGAPHGGPTDSERHAGDFGNIEVDADGSGYLEIESDMLSLDDSQKSAIGRAVILHEGEDDLVSQPTGAAGARSACGVVAVAGEMGATTIQEEAMGDEELGEGVDSPNAVN